jgi:hypothetical protein
MVPPDERGWDRLQYESHQVNGDCIVLYKTHDQSIIGATDRFCEINLICLSVTIVKTLSGLGSTA